MAETDTKATKAVGILQGSDSGVDAARFPSLRFMQAAHRELLKVMRKAPDPHDMRERILEFLARGRGTGALLDAFEDRSSAQSLLDYWTATLYTLPSGGTGSAEIGSAGTSPPPSPGTSCKIAASPSSALPSTPGAEATPRSSDTSSAHPCVPDADLAEFDADSVLEVANAGNEVLNALSEADLAVAKQILLRLVRLPPDNSRFQIVTADRVALEAVGEPERARRILEQLLRASVLRGDPADRIDADTFTLRFEALTRSWDRMSGLLYHRLGFRNAVNYWKESGKSPAALISDEVLEDARQYHDLNELERQFIAASRSKEDADKQRRRRALGVIVAVLALGCVLLGALSVYAWNRKVEAEVAKAAVERAQEERDQAAASRREAWRRRREEVERERYAAENARQTAERSRAELAELLGQILEPKSLEELRMQPDKLAYYGQRSKSLLQDLSEVETLRNTSSPLRPGCWVALLEGDRTTGTSSVCCLVQDGEGKRYALVFVSPSYFLSSSKITAVWAKPLGELRPISSMLGSRNVRQARQAPADGFRQYVGFFELPSISNADNRVPLLATQIRGLAASFAAGDDVTLVAGGSGIAHGRILGLGTQGEVLYKPVSPAGNGIERDAKASTAGDSGGPVLNARRELVGMHIGPRGDHSLFYPLKDLLDELGWKLLD